MKIVGLLIALLASAVNADFFAGTLEGAGLMKQVAPVAGTCTVGATAYDTFTLDGLPDVNMNGCYKYLRENDGYSVYVTNSTVFTYFPTLITSGTPPVAIPTWGVLYVDPVSTNVTNLCVTEDKTYVHPTDIAATAAWYCAPPNVKLVPVPAGSAVTLACEACTATPVSAGDGTCSCTCSVGADGSITSLITPTNTTAPADNTTVPLGPGGLRL